MRLEPLPRSNRRRARLGGSTSKRTLASLALALLVQDPRFAQTAAAVRTIPLDASTAMEVRNGRVLSLEYRGRKALKLAPLEGHEHDVDQELVAVLTDSDFQDGVIELDVAGARREGYASDNASAFKGFIGVSFRVTDDGAERFYLRPENARLDDQVFRNRATQYESEPEFPWQRLRAEAPGVYESYVDLEPGAWTRMRIEVAGAKARLYVNGAKQPCLVVNDLKHGASRGRIALWTRISSEAYFSDLRVTEGTPRRGEDLPLAALARTDPQAGLVVQPDAARFLEVRNGRTELVDHLGRRALHLVPSPETQGKDEDMLAILAGDRFQDGVLELDVAGAPRAGTPPDSRGFIGLAFRTGEHGEWSEVFYLRPTNARADDQLRRNHSVQYVSHPDFPWNRLRQEHPGKYESYADLEPGVWTSLRIVVAGTTARLHVNGAEQPCLVVTDLKHGDGAGRVALWAHVETDAYFGALTSVSR